MKFYSSDTDYDEYLHGLLNNHLPELYNVGVGPEYQEHTDLTLSSAVAESVWHNSTVFGVTTPDAAYPVRVEWTGCDNAETYRRHLDSPDHRELLAQNGWIDREVVYEINSEGWRSANCREYDIAEPSLVVLGCSFTYGTGLNLEQTWGAKLAQRMGLTLVNLGMPGHSLDLSTAWLMLNQHRLQQPRAVIICETPPARMSWLTTVAHARTAVYTYPLFTLVTEHSSREPQDIARHHWIINNLKLNSAVSYFKNRKLVEYWAKSKNIPFVHFNALSVGSNTYARDLAHFGEDWHDTVALGVESYLSENT